MLLRWQGCRKSSQKLGKGVICTRWTRSRGRSKRSWEGRVESTHWNLSSHLFYSYRSSCLCSLAWEVFFYFHIPVPVHEKSRPLPFPGMANCPVDSMKGGGLSWFSDLTVADPYYILPLLTSATLFIQFKLGVEYGTKLSQSTGAGKVGRTLWLVLHHSCELSETSDYPQALMYIFPPLLLIFTHSFPAALTFYWLTTNVISVAQVCLLSKLVVSSHIPMNRLHFWGWTP